MCEGADQITFELGPFELSRVAFSQRLYVGRVEAREHDYVPTSDRDGAVRHHVGAIKQEACESTF